MLRTAHRRLRLEPCEERSLPASYMPIAEIHTLTNSTAHTSTAKPAGQADDDDAEYTSSEETTTTADASEYKTPQPVTKYPSPKPTGKGGETSAAYARAETTEYARVSVPAIPPMPAGPMRALAIVPFALPATTQVSSAVVVVGERSAGPVVNSPSLVQPMRGITAAVLPNDEPEDSHAGPRGATEDRPVVPETELPAIAAVPSGLPFVDDLDLHVDLSGWANTAARFLDGLDAVVNPFVGESAWVRLGYWALAVGTVGVTVELTRQGLRTKQPDLENESWLPVTR